MTSLNTKQQKLLEISADNADDIEADVEEMRAESSRIMHEVMTDPAKQDEEIFEALGLEPGITLQALSTVPVIDRGEEWQRAMTGLVAAARYIAFVDTQGVGLLQLSEQHNKNMVQATKGMSTGELVQAGAAGVRKDGRAAARERRNDRRRKD